jgi:hypothetical protein
MQETVERHSVWLKSLYSSDLLFKHALFMKLNSVKCHTCLHGPHKLLTPISDYRR